MLFSFPYVFGETGDARDVYGGLLFRLLPPGKVWRADTGSTLRALLNGLGDELERVTYRGVDLINESDPRTATETITEWEALLGLPDERTPTLPTDLAERRLLVAQRYATRGGQTRAFFEDLCAACGWTLVALDRFTHDGTSHDTSRVGHRVGARCFGSAYAYSQRLVLWPASATRLSVADTTRAIQHATHAHVYSQIREVDYLILGSWETPTPLAVDDAVGAGLGGSGRLAAVLAPAVLWPGSLPGQQLLALCDWTGAAPTVADYLYKVGSGVERLAIEGVQ